MSICIGDKNWCRSRFIVLINPVKQTAAVLDNFEQRYQKLRIRVSEWSGIMQRLHEENNCRLIMITLTIRKVSDYSPGIINDYMKKLKQHLGEKLFGFAWVAEIQERGAVHYHLLVSVEDKTRIKKPDVSGMWKWGMSRIELAKTPFYICKYIGKERQKDLERYPKSCRVYSVSYRLPEGRTRAFYEALREREKINKLIYEIDKNPDWVFHGTSVTRGYAEGVLTPSGYKLQ